MTELLIALAIFAIVAGGATVTLYTTLNVFDRSNELSECNTLLNTVANQIIDDLSSATAKPATTDGKLKIVKSSSIVEYWVTDGVLMRNGFAMLDEAYYKNKKVSFTLDETDDADNTYYTVTITITSSANSMAASRAYTVRPLCLNQYT